MQSLTAPSCGAGLGPSSLMMLVMKMRGEGEGAGRGRGVPQSPARVGWFLLGLVSLSSAALGCGSLAWNLARSGCP